MKKSYKLIDNCEFNNVCFSDLVSDLKRIIDNQTIIFNMLIEVVGAIKNNISSIKISNKDNNKEVREMKFLGEYVKTVSGISPQVVATSTTVNGAIVDRLGFDSAVITAITGAKTGTINSCTFKLQHGNALDGSDMADVVGATVDVTDANSHGEINADILGLKRYIRVVVVTNVGDSSSIDIGATVTLGNPRLLPV